MTTPFIERTDVQTWISDFSKQSGVPQTFVEAQIAAAKFRPGIVKAMSPSGVAAVKNWPKYREQFVNQARINTGLKFWNEHQLDLENAERNFGVPAEFIVSIIGIETYYGQFTGNFKVIDALTTLAFNYPPQARKDRSEYFRSELGYFLTSMYEKEQDPLSVTGSFAGAVGLPQFMPSSERHYAVDGNGDGTIDLMNQTSDAIASVANFLLQHGWQAEQPVFVDAELDHVDESILDGGLTPYLSLEQLHINGIYPRQSETGLDQFGLIDLPNETDQTVEYRLVAPNFYVITKYNRSYFYATAVADFANRLKAAYR